MYSLYNEQNHGLMPPQTNHGSHLPNSSHNPSTTDLGAIPSYQTTVPSTSVVAGGLTGILGGFPSVCTAVSGTIDPAVLEQVETNPKTEEYIWSHADQSLYELGNIRAANAKGQPGSIRMVFPPHTFICAWEKDGTMASPAFRPLHPHSNQWLKAQVCDSRCAYRAGTSSLKRPVSLTVTRFSCQD